MPFLSLSVSKILSIEETLCQNPIYRIHEISVAYWQAWPFQFSSFADTMHSIQSVFAGGRIHIFSKFGNIPVPCVNVNEI